MRSIQLFPVESDEFDTSSEDDAKQKDKATENEVSVEALVISSIEERMDTINDRVIKLEKGVIAKVDTMNRIMMIINIAMFAHLVACLF